MSSSSSSSGSIPEGARGNPVDLTGGIVGPIDALGDKYYCWYCGDYHHFPRENPPCLDEDVYPPPPRIPSSMRTRSSRMILRSGTMK